MVWRMTARRSNKKKPPKRMEAKIFILKKATLTWKRRWVCHVFVKRASLANGRCCRRCCCCHHCSRTGWAGGPSCWAWSRQHRPLLAECWAETGEPALCRRWRGHTRTGRNRRRIPVFLSTTYSLPAEACRWRRSYHPPSDTKNRSLVSL